MSVPIFLTPAFAQTQYDSQDVPKRVPPAGTVGTSSTVLNVTDAGTVGTDMVLEFTLDHTYPWDIRGVYLDSPSGTRVVLTQQPYFLLQDRVNAQTYSFSDSAENSFQTGGYSNPPGLYKPLTPGSLDALADETRTGTWTLVIADPIRQDDGFITAWSLTMGSSNTPPVSDAGEDIKYGIPNMLVHLDGTRSTDEDGDDLTYSWTQVSGPEVELLNADTATPSFYYPPGRADQVLEFELIVNDGTDSSEADTVKVIHNGRSNGNANGRK